MKLNKTLLAAGMIVLLGVALPARAQVFTMLHSFTNTPEGANPRQLAWMNGLFYGSSLGGGTSGKGSIFTFNTNGAVFSTIYSFTDAINSGNSPNNVLVAGNTIYGTAYGGTNGGGMIFAVNTDGTGFKSLYSFSLAAPDGSYPRAGLVLSGSTLYGTASTGGTNSGGILFKINTNGTGYAILHWFTNSPDGFSPQSDLFLSGNRLYGTTTSGGTNDYGTVFAINTDGSGYTILHSFSDAPDGNYPYGAPVLGSGVLYGTTILGGSNYSGTVFAVNTDGTGYKTLYHFTASLYPTNADGIHPQATLALNGSLLYGATTSAGAGAGGTLFQINTNGSGFTVIRNFVNNAATGCSPESGVVLLGNTLWGTTYLGGSGYGTLFSERLSPVITLQPQGVTVTNGNPATFTVNAADDSLINYSWYFNTATLLVGQTNNTLTLASATNNNAGTYTAVAADNFGSVTSSPASLTVVPLPTPPVITQQPQNATVTNGYSASFTNVASGTAPLFYQWYFNTNTPVAGGTNSILLVTFVTNTQPGYYTVIVTNAFGSATSSPARLTVIVPPSPPTIAQQPQNAAVTNGYSASFTNVASGTAPLFYQWYFNTNTPVAGGTNSILLVTFVTNTQPGYYSVIVTNAYGSATSSPAKLTVISTLPIIFSQPQDAFVTNGGTATYAVTAVGQSPLRYQWYSNSVSTAIGTALAGKTNSTYSLIGNNNNHRYYSVVITNLLGGATSRPALLTLVTSPLIMTNPQSLTVNLGDPATFSVTALGSSLRYQWYSNTVSTAIGTLLAGQTNSVYSFISTTNSNNRYYSVVLTNTYGRATSSPALLIVQTPSGQPRFVNFSFIPASRSFALTLSNTASSANRLWASTDLTATNFWSVVASNVMAANGLWLFTDTNVASTNKVRFYRASCP